MKMVKNRFFAGMLVMLLCWSGLGLGRAQGAVVINEVLANNVLLTEYDGSTPDWVELFNTNSVDVQLSGYSLTTRLDEPRKWLFPEGAKIVKGGYYIIYCDDKKSSSSLNTGFGLNADGETIYLYDQNTNLVDYLIYGLQVANQSVGRVPDGTANWTLTTPSARSANVAATLGRYTMVKVNEWMASDDTGPDWFELYNPEPSPIAIGGLYLSNAPKKNPKKFKIAPLSFIGIGSQAFRQFIADEVTTNGNNHVNFNLSKSGDDVAVFPETGAALNGVTFSTQIPNVSQGRFPDGSANWQDFPKSASPGASNYLPLSNVFINEVLTHTDPPQQDSVELYNGSGLPVLVGGWFISDSEDNLKKFQITPGTTMQPGEYKVFSENVLTNVAYPVKFNSSEGDWVYLSAADTAGNLTGYRSQVKYGAAPNGVSFGRYTNSAGVIQFPLQVTATLGSVNSGPRLGPVVINEIMYDPAPMAGSTNDNVLDEYVEIFNTTTNAVPLYDSLFPTNTWRVDGDISYYFPKNVVLPPGGYLMVVNFDPSTNSQQLTHFQSLFKVASTVILYGPYKGKLLNSGSIVELDRPDAPQGPGHINEGYVPYYHVDRVAYSILSPWPTNASSTGLSIQRKDAFKYGDDPTNWFGAATSAFVRNPNAVIDHDQDGMPDDWELQYAFNPFDPADAAKDANNNGVTNLQEFRNGTNPRLIAGLPSFTSVSRLIDGVMLKFDVNAGSSYTVQYKDSLSLSTWEILTNFVPATSQSYEVKDGSIFVKPARYYRLMRQ